MSDRLSNADQELRRILDLVAAGEVTPEAAALLLDAIAPSADQSVAGRPPAAIPLPPSYGPSDSRRRVTDGAPRRKPAAQPAGRIYRSAAGVRSSADALHSSGRELSREMRRFSREAKRISHEASKASKRDMKEALREAKDEIKRAFRLSVGEAKRAIADVEVELKTAFSSGDPTDPGGSSWLSSLARLGVVRDKVKHVARSVAGHPVRPGDRVTINNFAGDVVVTTWDESRVEVRAERTGWGADHEMAQDRAESMPLDVQQRAGEVRIEAHSAVPSGVGLLNLQRMTSDLAISVPRDVDLSITTKGGDVVVSGHHGQVAVTTSQGDVAIDGATGAVEVETVDGNIILRDCSSAKLGLTTVSGDVTVYLTAQPGGDYRLRSAEGDVAANLAPGSGIEVELETVRGNLTAGGGMTVLVRQPGHLRGAVHGAADAGQTAPATLRIVTINGDASVA